MTPDELFIELCLSEALAAFEEDEVPVGAIIVSPQEELIAKGHNQTIRLNSPIAHAEILAIQGAAKVLDNYRLTGCTLYVTKEPCIMCAGALIEARIQRVVFGCYDSKRGALGSISHVNMLPSNHRFEVTGGVLEMPCRGLLQKFFRIRRGTEVVITGPTRNRLYA